MSLRLGLLLTCGLCAFAAAEYVSVADIVSEVRAAVAKHNADGPLAKILHKYKPSERLDDHAVEELESLGAGPKAVAELERLRDLSRALPAPAVAPEFPHDDTPSIPDQRRIVGAAQRIALSYANGLPDFLCTEVIHRYDDVKGVMSLKDTVDVRLSYFDQHENYRVLSLNGKITTRPFADIGGAVSEGEFGSLLASIFVGESKTVLRWDHWTTIRKRLAHVYTFKIPVEHSSYKMVFRSDPRAGDRTITAGQHGLVYVDRETNQILRILAEADLPESFPIRQSSTLLDYNFTEISGRRFLLPLRAVVRMATDHVHTLNMVEFKEYRKFTGESTITFQ
jgi:hypothetical protein